jgi:type I restriction enzyme R subunit
MTNFDRLKNDPRLASFADVAAKAEQVLSIDPAMAAVGCRKAAEMAVNWMYSVDSSLTMPYQSRFVTLLDAQVFRDVVPPAIWERLNYIRRLGNICAHQGKTITRDQVAKALRDLYSFFDFISYCYGSDYEDIPYDDSLVSSGDAPKTQRIPADAAAEARRVSVNTEAVLAKNEHLREGLSKQSIARKKSYQPRAESISEYETRKVYIDTMLEEAGWVQKADWIDEYELPGMPNKAGVGYADYVLFDDDGTALAVVEAKKTCVEVETGRNQARLYADALEKRFGRRPVVFLTNGFESRIIDGRFPERRVSTIYSKRDLQKLFNLRASRRPLTDYDPNPDIAGRYYQVEAIKRICESFESNKRRALLVMATGSGKTRTVVSLVDILMRAGWIKNVLFLADRAALVTQAKRAFVSLLPNVPCCNLLDADRVSIASDNIVFSTYPTMMNCIDDATDKAGERVFSSGHFDLIILDEAHRSIYNRYRDVLEYFDAPLVGLTATPREDLDKDTYGIFGLEPGVPTYAYDLDKAVEDGYLVNYRTAESSTGFLQKGIKYDDLSDEDKAAYEDTFADEDGSIPKEISSGAIDSYVFNRDTIRNVLSKLMDNGLRVDYGGNLGKTVIFATSHYHAEKILDVWNEEYPNYPEGYCQVIDTHFTYAQNLIDKFATADSMPQIAISVDMLDTGIDVPEILNLVFFKKVYSRTKFWQMIGRGTRLCPGLIDGEDKSRFYIFDFLGNFEFFRVQPKGIDAKEQTTLQSAVFGLRVALAYEMQDLSCQIDELKGIRRQLVDKACCQVQGLDQNAFNVHQHLGIVEVYKDPSKWTVLTFESAHDLAQEVGPLLAPDDDDFDAMRFDAAVFRVELARARGKRDNRAIGDVVRKARKLSGLGTIPAVEEQASLIKLVSQGTYVIEAGLPELEEIRAKLRELMKYIQHEGRVYETDFDDDAFEIVWDGDQPQGDLLPNYKLKVESYVRQNQDVPVIHKLKTNQPLTTIDVDRLENLVFVELGTHEQYFENYGEKPVGYLVREVVGMDMNAAKEAFSRFLDDKSLNADQIWFVNQVVSYVVRNGTMELKVLQGAPFNDRGSIVKLFSDDMDLWEGIRGAIERVNSNANVA